MTDRTNEVDEEVRCVWKAEESSDDGEEVTPVPIPNTEVKLFSADGSWGSPPVRVGRRWDTWATCPVDWDNSGKPGLIPNNPFPHMGEC